MKTKTLRVLLPIGILGVGVLGVLILVVTKPPVEEDPPKVPVPLIRVIETRPETVQFVVEAHGTVVPRREGDLIPQVSGDVVWVSPHLAAGGFIEEGEPLVRIDRADYEVALERARASVASAESEFRRAEKEQRRQKRLADQSVASQTRIDDAENAYRVARAKLREARAQLESAERDLVRTELTAPYAGRVRSEMVAVGQFAQRGGALARIYAVDWAEVRLPLPDRELAYLDVPLAYRNGGAVEPGAQATAGEGAQRAAQGPEVVLRAEFAGREHSWRGRIVRTEGELDPKSRMVNVVARVEDPYGRGADVDRPPLAVGMFVTAEILGRVVDDAFVVPRTALRRAADGQGHRVLVVDDESRLRFRSVELLRTEREQVVLRGGLAAGERVCISPLRAVTDGMQVRILDDPPERGSLAGAPQ